MSDSEELTPEMLEYLKANKNKRNTRKQVRNSCRNPSSKSDGGSKNGSTLQNIKFTVNVKNKEETLRKRFSGDDHVSDIAQAITDQVRGNIKTDEGSQYGSKKAMYLHYSGKILKMDQLLSSLEGIKGDEGSNLPIFVVFTVIGGASLSYDEKKEEERERLADFENEKRIKPTFKPDCIYGYNSKKLRVKMPCGHVFEPNTLFKITQMYVNNLTQCEIKCPIIKCKQIWPFDIIISAADLDDKETEILRKTLSMYKVDNTSANDDIDIAMMNINDNCKVANEKKQNISDSDNVNKTYSMNFSQYCEVNKGHCCGLHNLGMTCFMNSALQCLMHTPNFSKDLLGYLSKQRLDHKEIELKRISRLENDTNLEQIERDSVLKARQYLYGKFYGSNNDASTGTGTGRSGGGRSRSFKEYNMKRDCILHEWIYILDFVHGGRGNRSSNNNCYYYNYNTYNPKEFRNYLCKEDSQYCDGGQHDACQALLIALNGMERDYNRLLSLNEKSNTKVIPIELKYSIFDKRKNNFNERDNVILNKIQSNGYLNVENSSNIITKHFGSIQVTKRTCMNCGYGNVEYQQYHSLEVPIVDEYLELSLLKFDNKLNKFIDVLNGVHVSSSSKIKLAKFYGLFYDKRNKEKDIKIIQNSGMCNELDNWDIIKVNGSSSSSSNNMIILNDGEALRGLTKVESLLMIENERICDDNTNDLKSIFDNIFYYKVVICYVLPSHVSKNNNCNNSIDPLYFSILKIPCKQHLFTNKTLRQELEKTNKYQKIINLLNKHSRSRSSSRGNDDTQYSLVISINGKKYDSFDANDFALNKNINIICTFENTCQLNKQRKIEDKLATFSSTNEIYKKFFSDIGETDNDNKLAVNRLENEIKRLTNEISDKNNCVHVPSNNFVSNLVQNGNGIKEDRKEKDLEAKIKICKLLLSIYEIKVSNIRMVKNALNLFNKKYGIRIGNNGCQFVRLMSKKLLKINDCINLYYNKSYVSSNTFEMKCQCYKLGYDLKYSPIVYIEKKLLNRPNILILKLDRGDISVNKTSHTVKFGAKLKLETETEREINIGTGYKYNLFGVSYHRGNNKGGHYTARIKRLGTNNDWYYCNDESIQQMKNYGNGRFNNGVNVPCDFAMFMCYAKE